MKNLKTSSITQQVAKFLREGIREGRWKGQMPGRRRLASELGGSVRSVQLALELLEKEGLLVSKGGGKRREIVLPVEVVEPRSTRIGIMPFNAADYRKASVVELKHQLMEAGHSVIVASKPLTTLRMQTARIERELRKHEVDAWVVISAPREVLEWFVIQAEPVFAFWGGHLKMPIAGTNPKKTPATTTALERLISLGHRRIVYLVRPQHIRTPPIVALQAFIDDMEAHGIPVGSYNMPKWEESLEGFHRCLDSLFAHTPPTAMIIDEAELFLAAKDHLANMGIRAPEHVSLICTDPDRSFQWYQPRISHLSWSLDTMIRHVVRWANKVSVGKDDRRKSTVTAKFVEGGTIGPAMK